MSAKILDGRIVRDAKIPELTTKVKALFHVPTLAIIQVGDRPDSTAFIKVKTAFAAKIGVTVKHIHLPENATEAEVVQKVEECNEDENIRGIIVQLPLPISIEQDVVIETISPDKDVDGLTATNVKQWLEGDENAILAATTRGVKELFEYYKIELFGKHVVVVGRSMLVGKPLAAFCLNQNATVTICHSKTPDIASLTKMADVIIVAAGRPNLIGKNHVKEGAVVIDVGINANGLKLVGDVDFEAVKDLASAIFPVPGGVGPMTVLSLFENLLDLCNRSNN